jgi:hypothetical protein
MTQSALYFPHINVPTTQWTVQSILYWDTLKSIVPMEQLQHPEALDPLTRELLAEGLVESIIPGRFLWQVERFRDAFVDYLESQRIRSRIAVEQCHQFGDPAASRRYACFLGKHPVPGQSGLRASVAEDCRVEMLGADGQGTDRLSRRSSEAI